MCICKLPNDTATWQKTFSSSSSPASSPIRLRMCMYQQWRMRATPAICEWPPSCEVHKLCCYPVYKRTHHWQIQAVERRRRRRPHRDQRRRREWRRPSLFSLPDSLSPGHHSVDTTLGTLYIHTVLRVLYRQETQQHRYLVAKFQEDFFNEKRNAWRCTLHWLKGMTVQI